MQDNFYSVFITAYDGTDELLEPQTEPEKIFKQDDVNKIVQDRLERERAKIQKETADEKKRLADELEQLRQSTTITEEEKNKLTDQIKTLRNQSLSIEEQKNREVAELANKLKDTETSLSKQAKEWKERYFSSQIETELREAAKACNARVPEQLVALNRNNTTVKEILDESGKPTGVFKVFTTITEFKEDGSPFQVELSPMDAIKRLKQMPHIWGNQFQSDGNPGIDMMSVGNAPSAGGDKLNLKDYNSYKNSEARKKQVLGK